MKYKNRIRQLTKKYSYKELFLQVQELLSREDNLNGSKIKLNLFRRENVLKKLSQEWKNRFPIHW